MAGGNCEEGEKLLRSFRPDVVILDYSLPDGNAIDLMSRLKSIDPGLPVIILTGHGSIDLAVQAVKQGADQFLTKPPNWRRSMLSSSDCWRINVIDNANLQKEPAGAGIRLIHFWGPVRRYADWLTWLIKW